MEDILSDGNGGIQSYSVLFRVIPRTLDTLDQNH